MCEECEELSNLYLAYFNKPGDKRWRPAQTAAASGGDRYRVQPVPVEVREVRRLEGGQNARSAVFGPAGSTAHVQATQSSPSNAITLTILRDIKKVP